MNDSKRTVLVIEDDDATRAVVEAALSDEGYSVLAASTPDDGLMLAARHTPALILLDLYMPQGGGMYFLESYQPTGAAIVLMSAASDTGRRHEVDGKADAFLAKPFELDDLIAIADRYCNGR